MRSRKSTSGVLRLQAGLFVVGASACSGSVHGTNSPASAPETPSTDVARSDRSGPSDPSDTTTLLDASVAYTDAGPSSASSNMRDAEAEPARDAATSSQDAGTRASDEQMQPEDAGSVPPSKPEPGVAHPAGAQRVIFDSDMSSDWDDVGDIAVLHGLASLGEVDILAMAVSSQNGATATCMDAINTYYGKPDIPIGVRADVGGAGGYPGQITNEFPHGPEQQGSDFPLAVDLYRKVLAAQPDKSVTIITTGFLTNLKVLLASKPDQYSPLDGRALVAKKVKLLSCAGGMFPSGAEFNFGASGDDSAFVVLNDWPSSVMYVGYDVGQVIQTAGRLAEAPEKNPIRRVYVDIEDHYPYPAWGQISVYYAARAAEGLWGAVTQGHNQVEMSGINAWVADPDPTGDLEQGYLLEQVRSPVREALDALIMLAPNDGSASRPGEPSNLRVKTTGSGQVDLEWTDNAFNESGFVIERGVNGTYSMLGRVGANVTHYSDTTQTSAKNVAYRVKAVNATGDSLYANVWVYSGWTEVNFGKPGDLPLYSYYRPSDLRWSRGGDFRPDHVALNDDSQHGQNLTVHVDVGALGSEGNFHLYFFYQDPDNWYRLNADLSSSMFEKRVAGTTTQIGASGEGVPVTNGSRLAHWQIDVTPAGALKFSANDATVLQATEAPAFTGGKIGLGGVARTPVWENFHFETM